MKKILAFLKNLWVKISAFFVKLWNGIFKKQEKKKEIQPEINTETDNKT